MKNERGFTLVEMMIVLFVIAVLLIITIPNVAKHNERINDKGCEAYVKMVQAQAQAYQIEHNKIPTLEEVVTEYGVKDSCPDERKLTILDGEVTVEGKAGNG